MTTNIRAIEKWFGGKALKILTETVLPALAKSEADGEWQPGASRKVRAALNKCTVAHKLGRKADEIYKATEHGPDGVNHAWFSLMMGLSYADRYVAGMEEAVQRLAKRKLDDEQREVVRQATQFLQDFTPVIALMDKLDATRPKPVYVLGGTLSATVAKTLQGVGLTLQPETTRMPEIRWELREGIDPKGRKFSMWVGIILWPKGTQHSKSRFAFGTENNDQCEACGHAIKNPGNWVPLLLDDIKSVPHSLWVGRDCAKSMFGVDMKGEADYE